MLAKPDRGVDIGYAGTSLVVVLRCPGRIATIFVLCCAIGLHWVALQSVAWTTMVIKYSKHLALRTAITQAFDGAHPCSLCHAVNTGKNSEKKSDLQSPIPIDILCLAQTLDLIPPCASYEYAAIAFPSFESRHSPPVPPPRSVIDRVS
jgi:hypothetical protein